MPDKDEYEEFRQRLIKKLTNELLGPEHNDPDERQRELLDVSPLQLYATGVLFPQGSVGDRLEEDSGRTSNEDDGAVSADDQLPDIRVDSGLRTSPEESEREEQPLNLANEFNPSAAGLTLRVDSQAELKVTVSAGRYTAEKVDLPHPRAGEERADGSKYPATRTVEHYRRVPITHTELIDVSGGRGQQASYAVPHTGDSLKLHVRLRPEDHGRTLVSLTLVNHHTIPPAIAPPYSAAFFQVRLEASASQEGSPFQPIDRAGGVPDNLELASLDLLYRNRRSFALGHGCGADWTPSVTAYQRATAVRTEFLPKHELKPVRPREQPFAEAEFDLSMRALSEAELENNSSDYVASQLQKLANDYEAWIDSSEKGIPDLEPGHQAAARRHIAECRTCLKRIQEGIDYLRNDSDALMAFRLANRAMLIQQVRTHLPDREPNDTFEDVPGRHRDDDDRNPRWRPFQIAFVLMNITCCSDRRHPDRAICDLIWFPTGGGKTEAYLGLAAFTIALRRLQHPDDQGTTVLMRYTLRLLTTQQFQRAAALITALEVLRQDHCFGANLGESPISIGLWVGMGLTPNRRSDAITQLNQLRNKEGARNPFQLLRCPWCRSALNRKDQLGYENEPLSQGGDDTVVFRCPNSSCRWHDAETPLPVMVIDDDIYDLPPTLLLGTVDKFAQLAWEPRTGRLFGVNLPWSPPNLIIQDELHLISGPLGTIVGVYETAIEELCKDGGASAKIVASTATIREANKQCHSLYARNTSIFPTQGLDAGDSYFAYEESDAPGRMYVGVFGTAVKSHATAQVRVVSPLLQSVMPETQEVEYKEEIADGYSTVLWYFNSLRELGHAVTMCTGDIPEHQFNLCRRLNIDKDHRRLVRNIQEMTSRRTADEIPRILDELNRTWSPKPGGSWPVDILLATNMISVGVDIARLGVMVVAGQPKTTSEYIQSTSRVGRSFPGLVVTVYNPARSRDRSHYEQFVGYHQALYRHVEPTSVTPFSAPARSRAFAGLVIAMARLIAGVDAPDRVDEYTAELQQVMEAIRARVQEVDERELEDADREIADILARWVETAPPTYGRMAGKPDTRALMYPYGRRPDDEFELDAFPVLTSMRNVDATCIARVITNYPRTE